MIWPPGQPAPAQTDPGELRDGDLWTRVCGLCGLRAQGGRDGLSTHMATVHPEARENR
jgi:hypothetical protein